MTLAPLQPHKPGDERFHWTVDTFYRAISADVFDEPNCLELVNGEIWTKEPVNPPHATLTARIARLFRRLFEPGLLIRDEKPLHVSPDAEPTPIVMVLAGTDDDYELRHPTPADARLIVEVADASLNRDTGEKALLYARAGIRDYWVSVVPTHELLVFRAPTPDGYPPPQRLRAGDTIRPLAAPTVEIPVADLVTRGAD